MKVVGIAFTCYPVTRFYEGILGLKEARFFGNRRDRIRRVRHRSRHARDWERRTGLEAIGGGSVGFEVDDFDAAIARLRASGCDFRLEPLETPVCLSHGCRLVSGRELCDDPSE